MVNGTNIQLFFRLTKDLANILSRFSNYLLSLPLQLESLSKMKKVILFGYLFWAVLVALFIITLPGINSLGWVIYGGGFHKETKDHQEGSLLYIVLINPHILFAVADTLFDTFCF